ncbi:maleylpyruvate isomerase family mycothiol-dependent enzyme [Actinophytocola sediminis]
MDVARLVTGLHDRTAGFATTVAGADPNAMVPTCPEWPLRVLVGHIGQAHRWAADIINSGPSPVPDPVAADPGQQTEWPDWLKHGAEALADAALAAGERPVWTFFGPGTARFWLRRMLHDTTVHHADAALTTGTTFHAEQDLAADAISEWLEMLSDPVAETIKPAFAHLRGTGQTLQLRPDDETGWLITRTPDGVRWTRATAAADTTLTGTVEKLLLVVTRRLAADQVTVTGDRELAEHWLAHSAA